MTGKRRKMKLGEQTEQNQTDGYHLKYFISEHILFDAVFVPAGLLGESALRADERELQ